MGLIAAIPPLLTDVAAIVGAITLKRADTP